MSDAQSRAIIPQIRRRLENSLAKCRHLVVLCDRPGRPRLKVFDLQPQPAVDYLPLDLVTSILDRKQV